MKKKFTVMNPDSVVYINEYMWNDNTRELAAVVNNNGSILRDSLYRIAELEHYIESLQDTGFWIEHINDPRNCISYLECSKCNHWFKKNHLIINNYCPNCGSKNE